MIELFDKFKNIKKMMDNVLDNVVYSFSLNE